MARAFERILRNDLGELPAAAQDVREHLVRARVEKHLTHAIDVALEELLGNTIRYGYDDGQEHEIRIEVVVADPEVKVTLTDDARPFDPTQVPEPARPGSLAEAPTGGLGILMVRRLVQDMRYRRAGNVNTLELILSRARTTPA